MAGVLNFDQYLGGADQLKIKQVFPNDQTTLIYSYAQDITGWAFDLQAQTLVVDKVAFNRNSGQPNFSDSTVIGSFANVNISSGNVTVANTAIGTVNVTLPKNLYRGPIIPDARKNVPITVVSLTWTSNSSPAEVRTHRWALVQSWEPGVVPGDPILSTNPLYTAI